MQRDVARDRDRNRERVGYPDVDAAREQRRDDVRAAGEIGDVRVDSVGLPRTRIGAIKRLARDVVLHRSHADRGERRLCERRP